MIRFIEVEDLLLACTARPACRRSASRGSGRRPRSRRPASAKHRVEVDLGDLAGSRATRSRRPAGSGRRAPPGRPARAPRTPRSISAAPIPSSIDSASSAVSGASRKVTSLSTSTSTPPRPKATTLPNVGSVTAPTMTSCPPPAASAAPARRRSRASGVVGPRVGDDLRRTPAAHLGRASHADAARRRRRSCAGCPARRSSARPGSRSRSASAHRLVGGRRPAPRRGRDAVRVGDPLALGGGQRRAALGPRLRRARVAYRCRS